MPRLIKKIIKDKQRTGGAAFLWVRTTDFCYLYREKGDRDPIGWWKLDSIERKQLIETGLVDLVD